MKKSGLKTSVIFIFILSFMLSIIIPGWTKAAIGGNINDLALQAAKNNYGFHQEGTAVDGGWGNFSAYDAYILEKAGVTVNNWV